MSAEPTVEFESSALPGAPLVVRRYDAVEMLSQPYAVEVTVDALDDQLDASSMLGLDASLRLVRAGVVRTFVGLVDQTREHRDGDETVATVRIVPAFGLLALRRDSRVFQNLAVPAILEQVLTPGLAPYGREVAFDLNAEYPERELCIQYAETDLGFVQRLAEEEGIGYRFEHDGEVERLVFTDDNRAFEAADLGAEDVLRFRPDARSAADTNTAQAFELRDRLTHDAVSLRDFDFTQAGRNLETRGEGDRASYEHGHGEALTIGSYDEAAWRYQEEDGARQQEVRTQAYLTDARRGDGESRALGLAPGRTVSIADHPRLEANGDYLITRVEHGSGRGATHSRYHNRFEVIPLDTPYRPVRQAPRPSIDGPQTAVVTGPSGEEIHPDPYGRIKVRFLWDRLGAFDETCMCWVRVQQSWAGAGWGHQFVPRIGMEVVVFFQDGDPDRPIVTGAVYDSERLTPYTLPDEKTLSTVKTESTLGGGGFNELRFEDRAGEEQVYTHAQKNYDEVVENDHTTTVHHDQQNVVDNDQTQRVGANQTERVDVNQTMDVGANRTVHVVGNFDEKVDGTETRHIGGAVTEDLGSNETRTVGASLTLSVGADETRTIAGSQSEEVSGSVSQSVGAASTVNVAGTRSESIDGGISQSTPGTYVVQADSGWSVNATAGITLTAPAGAVLNIPGGVKRVDSSWVKNFLSYSEDGSKMEEIYVTKAECVVVMSLTGTVMKLDVASLAVEKEGNHADTGGPNIIGQLAIRKHRALLIARANQKVV